MELMEFGKFAGRPFDEVALFEENYCKYILKKYRKNTRGKTPMHKFGAWLEANTEICESE